MIEEQDVVRSLDPWVAYSHQNSQVSQWVWVCKVTSDLMQLVASCSKTLVRAALDNVPMLHLSLSQVRTVWLLPLWGNCPFRNKVRGALFAVCLDIGHFVDFHPIVFCCRRSGSLPGRDCFPG